MTGKRIARIIAIYAAITAITIVVAPRIASFFTDALIVGQDKHEDDAE